MGKLLSLRSYGRAISRSDGPTFRFQWSEDSETVTWDAGKDVRTLEMNQLRQLGRGAWASATKSMARLMHGLTPTLKVGNIRDTLSNNARGYSFV